MGAVDVGALRAQGRQVAIGLAGTLGAALVGLVAFAFVTADSRECLDAIKDAQGAVSAREWEAARSPVHLASMVCGARRADEIAAMAKGIKTYDEGQASDAKIAAAKKVADAADKERGAVEGWPDGIEAIRNAIKSASIALARGSLEKAAPSVKVARVNLDEYAGTSIATTDSWIALDAKTTEFEAKVKPYVDQVNATVAAERALGAAEDAKDRAAGYVETKENFVVSSDLAKIEKAYKYLGAGDREGFALYIHSDPEIAITQAGLRVRTFEKNGFAGSFAHVRVKGTLAELWINRNGLASF